MHFVSYPWSLAGLWWSGGWLHIQNSWALHSVPWGNTRPLACALWSVEWQHFQIACDWRDQTKFADRWGKMVKCAMCVDLIGSLGGVCASRFTPFMSLRSRGCCFPAASRHICRCVWVSVYVFRSRCAHSCGHLSPAWIQTGLIGES